ncbi:MAG: Gfo/Idh/MocA family oxidoreductase [Lachnospiraceae bacterium]|nr:Gfo/Idh/MocA family oxidoreductase [Lachnospiraceae bacterium]
MINVGIIGCGRIAQVRHIPEYEANENARICGFYDINQDRAEELAKKYQARAYASYEELLADDTIDAVSVCAANSVHASITIAALKAGKHVLCEKPMAVTLADCEAMAAASKENDRILMIDQNQRLAQAHREAKRMIDEGEIGDILTFRTTFGHGGPETWSIDPGKNTWFFDKDKAVMGSMADLGIHKTDLIQFLTSQKIVEVTARLATLHKKDSTGQPIGVDDNAFCIYRLSDGAMGTMTASWTHYGAEDNSTVLYGTKGIMKIYDDPVHTIVVTKENGTRKEYDVEAIQTNDSQTNSGMIDVFIDCLENGNEPEISGESVLQAMRAVFVSMESSQKGCTVTVNQEKRKG